MNAENEANSASVDYSTKGINYGILFNQTHYMNECTIIYNINIYTFNKRYIKN